MPQRCGGFARLTAHDRRRAGARLVAWLFHLGKNTQMPRQPRARQ
jgi:hypothetical protein